MKKVKNGINIIKISENKMAFIFKIMLLLMVCIESNALLILS
ncbi:hypothetical protein CLOSBL3_12752 [Clostridiaceae bacterium BL-3]|nr:hypothetical protein CLOSBL3_12752 [Clostridiaceae bacterium BL-3]